MPGADAALLRRWRVGLGLTQHDLGVVLDVSSVHISRMECGHVPVSQRVRDFCAFVPATRSLGGAVEEAIRTRGSMFALATLLSPLLADGGLPRLVREAPAKTAHEAREAREARKRVEGLRRAAREARAARAAQVAVADPYALPPELFTPPTVPPPPEPVVEDPRPPWLRR